MKERRERPGPAGARRRLRSEPGAAEPGMESSGAAGTTGCRQDPAAVRHRTGGTTDPLAPVPAAAPAAARKERRELSLADKVRVLAQLEGPRVSQSELARRFGVSQPQICRILKNRERILGEWRRRGEPGTGEAARAAGRPGSAAPPRGNTRTLAVAPHRPGCDARVTHFGAHRNVAPEVPAELPDVLRGSAPCDGDACGETPVRPRAGPRLALLLCADGPDTAALLAVPRRRWTCRVSPALSPGAAAERHREPGCSGEPAHAEGTELQDWEGDEAAAPLPCPSAPELRHSLATLRCFLERRAASARLFQALSQLEDAVLAAAPGDAPEQP